MVSCLTVWEIRKSRYQLTKQQIIAQEISQYCPHPKLGTDDSPLLWWKVEHSKSPNLVKLARKYLCVCATSVPSKQVFSCSGHIVTDKRSLLKPDTVQQMVFLARNLPWIFRYYSSFHLHQLHSYFYEISIIILVCFIDMNHLYLSCYRNSFHPVVKYWCHDK